VSALVAGAVLRGVGKPQNPGNIPLVGLAAVNAERYDASMSNQSAFHRGVHPLLEILLPGKVDAVLSIQPDQSLSRRIEELAAKSTEGTLSGNEREEYEGYVRANKFVATLRREARLMKNVAAA
jgi:hypothetical protein